MVRASTRTPTGASGVHIDSGRTTFKLLICIVFVIVVSLAPWPDANPESPCCATLFKHLTALPRLARPGKEEWPGRNTRMDFSSNTGQEKAGKQILSMNTNIRDVESNIYKHINSFTCTPDVCLSSAMGLILLLFFLLIGRGSLCHAQEKGTRETQLTRMCGTSRGGRGRGWRRSCTSHQRLASG